MSESRPVAPPETTRSETFTIPFASALPAGGTLNLNASARDTANNTGTAIGVTVQVRDVVAPGIASVVPANAATGVDPSTAVTLVFSEPMNRATLTAAAVRLAAGATAVPTALSIAADDRSVTLTPAAPLAINTIFAVTVDAGASDPAGNPLGTVFTSTFRTATPDSTAPQVESIDPPNNATGVGTTVPVSVTFSEPIDPTSILPSSFRVLTAGTPLAGSFAFLNGNRIARFTPSVPWPFEAVIVTELTGAILDAAGNALVTSAGQPIAAPLTFTFLTGNFAITSPAGTEVVERTHLTLTAQASAALNVASVVFSVNGTALPALPSAPFTTGFNVPARSSASSLTIVASARNAQNVEIARAEKVVAVTGGLSASPTVLGVPRGATRSVRFSIAEPAESDLAIALSAADPSVFAPGATQVTLPAGERHVDVPVTACSTCPWDPAPAGKAVGSTALVASSARGPAVAIVSVSDPIPGQTLTPIATTTGVAVSQAPTAGHFFTAPARTSAVTVRLLSQPLAGETPLAVTVTSSNPAVATATATAIQPGEQTITLTIDALANGVTVLTIRAGNEVRTITIVVGSPTPNQTPIVMGVPVGVAISAPPAAGQIVSSVGRTSTITIQILSAPHEGGTPLPVSVTSSDPSIATAVASAVQPGSQVTTLTITTLAEGFASLTVRAGTSIRTVGVFVGTPVPGRTPVVFAAPVGVSLAGLPFIGKAFAPAGTAATVGVLLLPVAWATATSVTVTSSNPGVVTVNTATVLVPAGSRMLSLDLTMGAAGTATLTLEFDGTRREFQVVVGSGPAPGNAPIVVAMPAGVSIVPLPTTGYVSVAPGTAVSATIGVQLLAAPRATPTPVTITTSNAAIVTLGGSTTVSTSIEAGSLTLPVPLLTTGTAGVAVLRFEFDGAIRDLVVIVGNLSPSQIPTLTAPVIGIRIDP